jgi:serine/threonine protein kinase
VNDKPDSTSRKPGPKMLGKYALVRELGRGGMGVVYEAQDTQLQRPVALKLLVTRQGIAPEQAAQERQRFDREAQAIAKLKHPNIVTLYEAGELQNRRFLAMELIAGRPFHVWWKEKAHKLPLKVTVLREVAMAVHHAHEQNILHRDLKPANILVDAANKPFVMDFGLAKAADPEVGTSLTSEGLVVGTPAYMSPEQARGLKTVDRRTDVYSMGVILYEILSGRQPFEGETAIDILMKASKERVAPPSSASQIAPDPALDRAIENICLKALARNVNDRYASAAAFAQDLSRWLKGDTVTARAAPTQRRTRVEKSSRGLRFGIAAAVAAAAAGVAAVLLSSSAPGVDAELSKARDHLRAKKYTEARIEYGKALAKDPSNREALAGDREAKAAEEKARQEEVLKEQRRQELADAQARSERDAKEAERIRLEAETKAKSAAAAASDAEQKRLMEELAAIREKARKAEEEARRAKEQLDKLSTERTATAPAPAPAPSNAPVRPPAPAPPPAFKPAPPTPLSPKEREAKLAALRAKRDAAVEAVNIPQAFAAIDQMTPLSSDVNPISEKSDVLKAAKKHLKAREDAAALALGHLRLAEEALAADDYKTAAQAAKDSQSIARQAGDATVAEQAGSLQKEITASKTAYDRFLKAQQTLASSPQDLAANSEAGRYFCLVKDRWEDGLPLLAKGSDEPLKKLAEQELAAPSSPDAQAALGDAWGAAGQKERNEAAKSRCHGRALYWYDTALPALRGAEKSRVEKKIDDCFRLAKVETRVTFVPEESMKLYSVGQRFGTFPDQKGDDALAPFRGEAVYFQQKTGTDAVYQVRSGRKLRRLYWKGAAMQEMTIEILDQAGTVIAKGGPWGGGNTWAEFTMDFPPTNRFTLRMRNHISTWYMVDTVKLE